MTRGSPTALPPGSERELIVVTEPDLDLRATAEGVTSGAGADVTPLANLLANRGATIRPLFDGGHPRAVREAAIAEVLATPGAPAPPDLSPYFKVDAPDEQLDALASELRETPAVVAAYVKPQTFPATAVGTPRSGIGTYQPPAGLVVELNEMVARAEEAPPATPDLTARQGYLGPAPAGIDAFFAHTQPGGRGTGVRIIDIEGAWLFTHEDLTQNQGGVVAGTPSTDVGWRNHGTAVIGEFGGDTNGLGITGICPDANVRAVSIFGGLGSAGAIRRAADLLAAGDIILIELHRPGPRASGSGQQGFIALEWWPDDFDAIRYATSRGVIVIEAAGNGAENLDDAVYDAPQAGFPATWANPFRRGARDSGAVLVGAGAPPPGTHGRDHGPDRSRLGFSNFGRAVDAQGWGREVTTTGYGDLQGGTNEDFWYTDQFSGTSSASPIVVGAVACAQGNRRARSLPLLTPPAARTLLRTTGSPQQDAPNRPATQRIGNRPDLRQALGPVVALTVPLFRYWNPANTDHFYTTNWAELGNGRHGWGYEGIQCFVAQQQAPGTVPLYRYWNPQIGDHFYTTNWAELGGGRYGWGFEGVQCYVYPQPAADRVPLFRYWNGQVGDHFYTTNFGELGYGRYGYRLEGIQCFVATMARPPEEAREEPGGVGEIPTLVTGGNGGMHDRSDVPQSFTMGVTTGMMGAPATFGVGMPGAFS
ncbi:MAG: S8 family serine peptidase, partial [Gemmatimonadales bacterium]